MSRNMALIIVSIYGCSLFGQLSCDCDTILYKSSKFGNQDCDDHSPIVLDLDSDNFSFSGPEGATFFDLYGTGFPLFLHWVLPQSDDAFLFHDINDNGIVDDGTELFGNGTILIMEDRFAPNGFVALAQFDLTSQGGDEDGLITAADQVWGSLGLWLDTDANGISDEEEVYTLESFGLKALETIPRESNRIDRHGNRLRFWARAHRFDLPRIKMLDVFFKEVSPGS